jgi:hypothetical protein
LSLGISADGLNFSKDWKQLWWKSELLAGEHGQSEILLRQERGPCSLRGSFFLRLTEILCFGTLFNHPKRRMMNEEGNDRAVP